MDFDLSIEQKILMDNAREVIAKHGPTENAWALMKSESGYDPSLWRKMAEMGWLGMVIPEEYGGSEGDFIDLAIHLEAMGEACMPGPFFSTALVGATAILLAGSEEQKNDLLPRLSEGKLITALAVIEPGSGYDAPMVAASAEKRDGQYILNGTKLFVENAHIADLIICLAKVNQDENHGDGMTLFLVERDQPGVRCRPMKAISGDKPCEVVFENVSVPEESILGAPGKASGVMTTLWERAAVGKCCEMVGCMQTAFNMAVSYAKQRVQFGRPIGSFQAIQHHCANMAVDMDSTRFLTYQAAYRIAGGLSSCRESAMAKAWAGEAAGRVMRLSHQIHGAIAFCEEHSLHLYYRRARAAAMAYGDSSCHYEKLYSDVESAS